MNQILQSAYTDLGEVKLPNWQGRQKYMHTFNPRNPVMAPGFEDYQEAVSHLCEAAGVRADEAHMTVDEKIVQPGMSQRRPGAHVDGQFMKEENVWGHPPPSWAHYCNELPLQRMSIIVAASVPGCKAYAGEFHGEPKNDGDLEHIRPQLGRGEILPPNRGYLLSPDCVHESMVFDRSTQRTFLRIAFSPAGQE